MRLAGIAGVTWHREGKDVQCRKPTAPFAAPAKEFRAGVGTNCPLRHLVGLDWDALGTRMPAEASENTKFSRRGNFGEDPTQVICQPGQCRMACPAFR
jgi:hypothetical protein